MKFKNKEEAIEFAKKYLDDRKIQSCELMVGERLDLTTSAEKARSWDIAAEYILNDIIPYLYGDALD